MYPITEAVRALFEAEQRKVLRITGADKNGTVIFITDDDVLEDSFQIDRYSCNGEKLEIGTAIAAQLTFRLENGNGQYDGVAFEGTELFAEVGVADWTQENPTVNWVPCGYFTPDMQPRRLTTISITALDRMSKFDVIVDAADLTFPTTIAGLVGQVCTACGVTLAQSISGLTNADVAVAALPSANGGMTTYRNLIQWCAGIMGTNAWFDWNGLLLFSWYDNATGYVSTMDNRYSSDLYEDDLTITGVEYTNDSGIAIVEGTDDYAIDLTGNAIAGPLIATVLPPLNTALNGFTYRPFMAAVINAPYLWPMDIVTFTDKGGNNHTGALTNVAFGLNGSTALESKGMTYAINKAAQPKGFTREQAQLINQVAQNIENNIDDALTQQEIFNRLTDNGAAQGLVLYNGQLYVNASYINAGQLNVGLINFRNYEPPYRIPDEYDSSSMLYGEHVEDGWIVSSNPETDTGYGVIPIISCGNAEQLRGQTIILTMTTRSNISEQGYSLGYINAQGEEENVIGMTVAPAYGSEDAQGNLRGAIDDGEYERYSMTYHVPSNATYFSLSVYSTGIRNIVVSEQYSQNFGLRYGNNIGLNYKGLQVGKFVVDRSGNATFNGDTIFNGNVQGITPANIGAVNKAGDTMTGPLTIDDANTTPNQYAEIARFKRPAMRVNDNLLLYLGNDFSTKNCGTLVYHHTGYGSNANYIALSGYNAPLMLKAFMDGHIELDTPLPIGSGGTGATTAANAIANLGALAKSGLSLDLNNATAGELQTGYDVYTNAPEQFGGFAVSIPMGQSARLQFWIGYGGSKIYMRAYNGLSWTSWKEFS